MKRICVVFQLVLTLLVVPAVAFCSCVSQEGSVSTLVPSEYNAWLEIDTLQFGKNIDYLRTVVGQSTKICVVMKGDAYGNGIRTLIPVVKSRGVECVAITSNDEARSVRNGGYEGRVVRIRLASEGEVEDALELGVEELVGSLTQAKAMSKIATLHGKTIKCHLAINAGGMSRNGMELKTGVAEAVAVTKLDGLKCVGMMTHYPTSNDGEIVRQLTEFKAQVSRVIKEAGLNREDLLLHTAATYAALYLPQTRLDMVRIGSALYNYGYTEKFSEFKKLMSFKSRVASVQEYPEGNTVNYKRTYKLKRRSRLANIPIGYANGFSKTMANKGFVLIRGHRCPVVGCVTMNITMVDVTDWPDIQSGDEVTIYGRQGKDEITSREIGEWGGLDFLSQAMFWSATNPKVAVGK